MFELMYEEEGVGLAANQVDLPYRMFVANPTGDMNNPEAEQVFINPVLSRHKGQQEGDEGCLSLPGIRASVVRSKSLRVECYDLSGNQVILDLEGFPARVVQHETDHLDGTLFIDRLSPARQIDVRPLVEEFEIAYNSQLATGEAPSTEEVEKHLAALEGERS